MSFWLNDEIEISIPIINEKGIIELGSFKQIYLDKGIQIIPTFKWKTIVFNEIPQIDLLDISSSSSHKRKSNENTNKEILDFDLSRFCELEISKNIWVNLSSRDPHNKSILAIKTVFEPIFIVKDIFCDDVGYIIYKIVLIACKEGRLSKNLINESSILSDIGISIVVKHFDSIIINEVKKNFLVYDRMNQVECRIGDNVIFYFTK